MASTDLERAVAFLALVHRTITPTQARGLIESSRAATNPSAALTAALVTLASEVPLLAAAAAELGIGFVNLHDHGTQWVADETTATQLGVATLKANNALPVRHTSGSIGVALVNPRAQGDFIDWLRARLGPGVPILLAPRAQIDGRLIYFDTAAFADLDPGETEMILATAAPATATANPVVEFVDNLFARAIAEGASDVHFLSQADGSLLVRFRIDSQMHRQAVPLRKREKEIIGTLLAKCGDNIDSSDRTRPQDGSFSFLAPGGRRIDARLGMLPQAHGPTVVVRLLDPENINRRLEDMGFAPATLTQMRRVMRAPQGSILFIGPTGSGKTTTLYALLKEMPAVEMAILTVEDPIEYRLPNIGQTQIRADLGEKSLTFPRALRSILRLDPDLILLGEIRDNATAETAMHAALTGHMVLSTLHAKTAVAAYQRLEELGVDPYLSSESLSLAVNQRLVRTVHSCAELGAPTDAEVAILQRCDLPVPDLVAHPRAGGCAGCNLTGFRGRLAAVEVMEPTPALKELVATRAPRSQISTAATSTGYTGIMADAFRHVLSGKMPVLELLRVAGAGEH